MKQTQYRLEHDTLSLVVDSQCGGRITQFALNNCNALTETGPQTGSTFWPSPQSSWGWPPPPVLDSAPYFVDSTSEGLALKSSTCDITGLQVRKRFAIKQDHAQVYYSMTNHSAKSKAWAPWEITRIYGGLTFYKSDQPPLPLSTGVAQLEGGVIWYDYDPSAQKGHEKIFGNGSSGWLANAYNELLLVKRFSPINELALVAPGEAEVEIYAHGDVDQAYIEIEQQGEYVEVAPGHTVHWRVDWYLRSLPKGTQCKVGNSELVRYVEDLLNCQ